jgi:Pregnancy-associated plasma protein-A/Secretion system C-terminal sorting domain
MKIKVLLPLIIAASYFQANAQYVRCGADAHQAAIEATNPQIKAAREAVNRFLENNPENRIAGTVTIPVVFHIIYNGATQNIPDNRIFEQLEVLNDDYTRNNADTVNTRPMFLPVAANTQIEFCLAQQTPTGAATTGIIRIPTTAGSLPNNPHTLSPEWDHTKYLNIYIGNLGGGLLGYANLPPGSVGNDHVVILYSAVGGPNVPGTANPYHLGRTATHEVGHWLNLQHTFQGGCAGLTAGNCTSQGDLICDTPPVSSPSFGCPSANQNTCTETAPFPPPYSSDMVDMHENYMDYTDDNCMNAFTSGQSTRMNAAVNFSRSQLLTSQGCVPVGLNEVMDPSYITLVPNPSQGIFQVQFNFPAAASVTLKVTDLAGRIVYESVRDMAVSSFTTLNLADKSDGVYQLIAITPNGYLVKRIVIAR